MEHADLGFLEDIFGGVSDQVRERLAKWLEMASADDLRQMELDLASIFREAADGVTAAVLQRVVADRALESVTLAAAMAGSPRALRRGGRKDVKVALLGGTTVTLPQQQYLKPDRSSRPGPRRKPGKRGKGGAGCYPVLAALGIEWGATPALSAEIARQVSASESFRSALDALKARGIDLGYKPTMRIVNRFGQRAVRLRNEWVEAIHAGRVRLSSTLRGKRVVVGIDGGRVRTRVPKRRGRRRKNGHRGFDTPWREPKLCIIYVINEKGEVDRTLRPVYDGTLEDCDAMFRLLSAYLKVLGAAEAEELVVLGDGAEWIWNRIPELVSEVGIEPARVFETVDWYHAVEYLGDTAKLTAHWTDRERGRWLKETERLLWGGRVHEVVTAIRTLALEAGLPELAQRAQYFEDHADRMAYKTQRRRRRPIGSGAAESAIRRVINLRLKGSAKFWLEENAEAMLLLRSYLKAGRFDDLAAWSSSASTGWWGEVSWLDPLGLDQPPEPSPLKAAA